MTLLEYFTITGTMSIVLGIFLTFYALINNRVLKAEGRETRALISSIKELATSIDRKTDAILISVEKADERAEERHREVLTRGAK